MILPSEPHFSFSHLSFAVVTAFAAAHESGPAVDAVGQGGAAGVSLVREDAVGIAVVEVVAGNDAEAVVPTTFVDGTVEDSEEGVVGDVKRAPEKTAVVNFGVDKAD